MSAAAIDDAGYLQTQEQLFTLARVVRMMPLEQFLSRIQTAHAVAPVMDPTLYQKAMASLSDIESLARALRRFQEEISRQLAKRGTT